MQGEIRLSGGWQGITAANPEHSTWYRDRWKAMQAAGRDIFGEARFIDAMVGRGSRILDAGCGTGRVGGWLAAQGHQVVGVDIDPVLIEAAKQEYPDAEWLVGDLAELATLLAGQESFDAIVCAGNVMAFIVPEDRIRVLQNFAAVTSTGGRVAVGFGAGRGYDFAEFLADAEHAGLYQSLLLSTWDLLPMTPESNFLVAVLAGRFNG